MSEALVKPSELVHRSAEMVREAGEIMQMAFDEFQKIQGNHSIALSITGLASCLLHSSTALENMAKAVEISEAQTGR